MTKTMKWCWREQRNEMVLEGTAQKILVEQGHGRLKIKWIDACRWERQNFGIFIGRRTVLGSYSRYKYGHNSAPVGMLLGTHLTR